MFIKFAIRRNLIYPLQYIIWSFVREILHMIINNIIEYQQPYIFLPLMFLGEILAGGIIYCYEKKIMKTKNEEKQEKYFMSIKLIKYDKDENDFFIPLDKNNFFNVFNCFLRFCPILFIKYRASLFKYVVCFFLYTFVWNFDYIGFFLLCICFKITCF